MRCRCNLRVAFRPITPPKCLAAAAREGARADGLRTTGRTGPAAPGIMTRRRIGQERTAGRAMTSRIGPTSAVGMITKVTTARLTRSLVEVLCPPHPVACHVAKRVAGSAKWLAAGSWKGSSDLGWLFCVICLLRAACCFQVV